MYDLIIKNVRVIDGTGAPWYRAAVALKEGRVARVGTVDETEGRAVVDGQDHFLVPGFIDIHTHSDTSLLRFPQGESRILQGVTTEIGGNCGISVAPLLAAGKEQLREYAGDLDYSWESLGEFLDTLEEAGISTNFGLLVGHGTLRIAAMGFDDRKPTKEEMEQMQALLSQALTDGAFGLSSGLIYPPGSYSQKEEMAELAGGLRLNGGFYATHMRDEGTKNVESLEEALYVAQEAGVPLQISHHKVIRKSHWGISSKQTVAMVEEARSRGVDVTVDQYPYEASSTGLDSNVPQWAFREGLEGMLRLLADPKSRAEIKKEVAESHKGRWGDIVVATVESEKNQWVVGLSLEEVAARRGVDPEDACFDILLEERGRATEINYGMCEEDIERIMTQRFTMIGSDGNAVSMEYPGQPHPRWYGTFPRVLAHYCRERKLFPLEEAVEKMTGRPAARIGLQDRGLIREGMWADLVLLDFDALEDRASYQDPKQAPGGILQVYVNGVLTAREGRHTGARAGQIMRKGRA